MSRLWCFVLRVVVNSSAWHESAARDTTDCRHCRRSLQHGKCTWRRMLHWSLPGRRMTQPMRSYLASSANQSGTTRAVTSVNTHDEYRLGITSAWPASRWPSVESFGFLYRLEEFLTDCSTNVLLVESFPTFSLILYLTLCCVVDNTPVIGWRYTKAYASLPASGLPSFYTYINVETFVI